MSKYVEYYSKPTGPAKPPGYNSKKARRARGRRLKKTLAKATQVVAVVEKKSYQPQPKGKGKGKTPDFGTRRDFTPVTRLPPVSRYSAPRANQVTRTGSVQHKEWGTGTRFTCTSYLGIIGNVNGASNVFGPVFATGQQLNIITPYYAYPLHPRTISLLDDISFKFARYAWREVEIIYHATCGTANDGGIMFALNTDIASAVATRSGSHGSYIQTTPSLNYHLSQDTHMLPAIWESGGMKWCYRGDRAWFCTIPGDDSGVTETLSAVELEQFLQVILWTRNAANAALGDLDSGHLELRAIIDFYEPRNGPIGLTSGSVGGSTSLTSSTIAPSFSTFIPTILRKQHDIFRAHGDEHFSQDRKLARHRSRSPEGHSSVITTQPAVRPVLPMGSKELSDSFILEKVGVALNELDLVTKSDWVTVKETVKRSSSKGPPSST